MRHMINMHCAEGLYWLHMTFCGNLSESGTDRNQNTFSSLILQDE